MTAPAGFRKLAFLRAYEACAGSLVCCDLPSDSGQSDIPRVVLDSLVGVNQRLAARSAADRLARRAEWAAASSRTALRREWPAGEGRNLFALRDASSVLATAGGIDLFAELVDTLPAARTLAVSMRTNPTAGFRHILARARTAMIDADSLALTAGEVTEICVRAGHLKRASGQIYETARGWPLVSEMLVRLATDEDALEDLLGSARSLPSESLFAYLAHRTIMSLRPAVRDALVVASLLRGATHVQLMRVLGDACDDVVFMRLAALPLVATSNARIAVHSEISALLRARFATLVRHLYERTLSVLTGEGAYVEAARVALEDGDINRAAAVIDAAPTYTAESVPLGEYERIIDRLDRAIITRFPNLWLATIPYRSFAVDRPTFVREAETVFYCLPAGAGDDQRAAALMLLASAYFNTGRRDEAAQLIGEALLGFAAGSTRARASLLSIWAWFHGMDGQFRKARELAAEAAGLWRSEFGEQQALHYIDVHEAAYRGQNMRIVAIIDELLRRHQGDELPLHRANAAVNGALFTWVNGDDDNFVRYVNVLDDTMIPGIERGFSAVIDAARGHAIDLDAGYHWPVLGGVAQLFRLGHTAFGDAEALEVARTAARHTDECRDPFTGILAHVALFVLDANSRAQRAAILESLLRDVESDELRQAVDAVLHGKPAGMLEPFVRKRVLREHSDEPRRLRVELLSGAVVRDAVSLPLSSKEFELVALLASAHAPLTRDRIGESLWGHLDPEEWPNNLKVTMSRLRRKVGAPDAVISEAGRYRLSPLVEVDVRRAEASVRESAAGRLDDQKRSELRAMLGAFVSAGARYDRFAWSNALTARLVDLACTAGLVLAEDCFARKDYVGAQGFAAQIQAIDAFNEDACALVVRILQARDETDAARREVQRYTAALANELGATPSQRLLDLVRVAH
jgi:DNA-binding SARP family transcriptional activator/tetratricopeptide (TPR) repeat protein